MKIEKTITIPIKEYDYGKAFNSTGTWYVEFYRKGGLTLTITSLTERQANDLVDGFDQLKKTGVENSSMVIRNVPNVVTCYRR